MNGLNLHDKLKYIKLFRDFNAMKMDWTYFNF